ncbi:hypothetical protein KPL76_14595 [Subtercola sp. PAMC28395]|uniref:hypothetical protein n=1 Tax=Subtercola sp. PAMC28395 TaxID=2846775 RepID=UPI001C0B110A|nr:hypothetical protein [Subtercola sp. PAMC28395]QWT23874.1 hypothetical protein KPL76_14595 [Subtercola sp. PAMC28395]
MTPAFSRRPATLLHFSAVTDAVDAVLDLIHEARAHQSGACTSFLGVVILVDGRSGSGKTDFSNALAEALTERWLSPVTLVHLDDIYPGWSGLEAASQHVHDSLLSPFASAETPDEDSATATAGAASAGAAIGAASATPPAGHPAGPGWRRHDWATGLAADWVTVDPSVPLIIEGTGSLSRQNASLATLTVWLELGDETRRERALARDGETYEPYWDMWAEQENEFVARENPRSLADVVVDLTPSP